MANLGRGQIDFTEEERERETQRNIADRFKALRSVYEAN